MDNRDCLAHYPFVVVRIACRVCSRRGSYRLARLAAKYGPEISLRDLTDRFSYDCLWRAEARSKKGKSAYVLTDRAVVEALREASARGVKVGLLRTGSGRLLPDSGRRKPHLI